MDGIAEPGVISLAANPNSDLTAGRKSSMMLCRGSVPIHLTISLQSCIPPLRTGRSLCSNIFGKIALIALRGRFVAPNALAAFVMTEMHAGGILGFLLHTPSNRTSTVTSGVDTCNEMVWFTN